MGKITDAMERSQKERKSSLVQEGIGIVGDASSEGWDAVPEKNEGAIARSDYNKNLVTVLRPGTYESEQFRMVKASLLFPDSGTPLTSIMVTSAIPYEGKSFVAANLAVSIAQNINEHVLLVDCDLRSPSIHGQFGFGDMPGLSDYLSDNASLPSVFLRTGIDKLRILPGGKPAKNAPELLSSKKMSHLLSELSSRYSDRYIIIDTPPPMLTAETRVIAGQVDGVVLVVGFRKTPRKLVLNLIDILGKEKILGVILNRYDVKLASDEYHRYGAYDRYYK